MQVLWAVRDRAMHPRTLLGARSRILSTQSSAVASQAPASTVPAEKMSQRDAFKHNLTIYSQLSKSRLSALVVMTSGAGFLMAGGPIAWGPLAACTVGTSLAAASANTWNQIWEIELDGKMQRTRHRPLPSGRVSREKAVRFGVGTAAVSTALLATCCNPLTAALGASNIGLYALAYTPMKTRSEWNTWVGAVVGAIPPMMGYAAATGSCMTPEALLQAAILFGWQFPHFFALSWRARKDYSRGGYQMVACNDPTGRRSADLIWKYSWLLAPVPIISALTDVTSYMFAVEGTLVNAYAIYCAYQFRQKQSHGTASKVFRMSLWYLPVLLGGMVLHSQNWYEDDVKQEKKERHRQLKEAFLGEIEHFEAKVSSAEDGTASKWVVNHVQKLRQALKDVCIHEYLWGVKGGQHNGDESSIACPVHVTRSAKETAAIVAHKDD